MAKVVNAFKKEPTTESPHSTSYEDFELLDMKRKVELINQGFVVHIAKTEKITEESNYYILKITLSSEVNRMPVFGDVELRIAKQAISKLKTDLSRLGQ